MSTIEKFYNENPHITLTTPAHSKSRRGKHEVTFYTYYENGSFSVDGNRFFDSAAKAERYVKEIDILSQIIGMTPGLSYRIQIDKW